MKKELECLKELLATRILRYIKDPNNMDPLRQCFIADEVAIFFDVCQGQFVLEEDARAMLNSVPLRNLGIDTLVLKPENFNVRFYKAATYNKSCDYLILTYRGDSPHAIFIDLKTDIYDPPDPVTGKFRTSSVRDANCGLQFCGAKALFKLLSFMVKTITKCNAFDRYKEHYWVLYKNALNGNGVLGAVPQLTEGDNDIIKTFRKSTLVGDIYACQVKNNMPIDVVSLC